MISVKWEGVWWLPRLCTVAVLPKLDVVRVQIGMSFVKPSHSCSGAPIRHGRRPAGDCNAEMLAVELSTDLSEVGIISERYTALKMT